LVKKVQDQAWKTFVRWCRQRGLRPLPANPWTIAAYIRWCEPRQRVQAIAAHIKSISRQHLLLRGTSPDRHPTVERTFRMVEIRARNRAKRSSLFRDEDFLDGDKRPPKAVSLRKNAIKPGRKKTVATRKRFTLQSRPKLVSRR